MPANNLRSSGRNRVLVPEAQQALENYKYEIANELGLSNYATLDKGELTSRQNGYVGGYMVRKMIQQAESQMAQGTLQPSQLAEQQAPKQPQGTTQYL
ncbi:MAG: alpha/beta-type small acid-soluble spore protein [Firmicutes bacterium]|nr:alpha/beta-type small acid-soluble spore protein [Bacillota bacterium]